MATIDEAARRVAQAEAELLVAKQAQAAAARDFVTQQPLAAYVYKQIKDATDYAYDGYDNDRGCGARLEGLLYGLIMVDKEVLFNEAVLYALSRIKVQERHVGISMVDRVRDTVDALREGKGF